MVENPSSLSNQETQFLSHLNNIVDISQEHQANVAIVGGIALRASMNQPVQFRRSNGTIPDIDMIGLGPNSKILHKTETHISQYCHQHSNCPPVSLESARFSDHPKRFYNPFEVLSGLRRDNHGEYYLTFRGVDQPIPYQTMDVIPRQYGSVKIPTLPQETTLHRYETRVGFIKPKDKAKIQEFREYIEQNGGDGLDEKLYQSYNDFCQKINKKHKLAIKISQLYWNIDYKLDGKISGSDGFIYKLKQFFLR